MTTLRTPSSNEEPKKKSIYDATIKEIVIPFGILFLVLFGFGYFSSKKYTYYNEFEAILKEQEVYRNASNKELEEQYLLWRDNKAYADILVDESTNSLVQVEVDPFFSMPDIKELGHAIYICSDDTYSYTAICTFTDNIHMNITLVRNNLIDGKTDMVNTTATEQVPYTYRFDDKSGYLYFLYSGTLSIDKPATFANEYVPLYGF